MLTVLRLLVLLLVVAGGWWLYQSWAAGRIVPPPTSIALPEKGAYRGPVHTPLGSERFEQLQERAQGMRY